MTKTTARTIEFPELPTTIYLTGVSTALTRSAHRDDLGLLVTPASGVWRQAGEYRYIGADNGLYSESKAGRDFDSARWLRWLAGLPAHQVLFAALPDVLEWHHDADGHLFPVGNVDATLERSARYVDDVRGLDLPVALVAQDGLTTLDQIPFDVDALFVGGSDDYKLGPDAAALVAEARAAGLWTHLGRVNSYRRLRYANTIGADSADGTYIGFGPSTNAPKVFGWLDRLAAEEAPYAVAA